MVVKKGAWIFENWAALQIRNGKLGPKGPRFGMLGVWEELFYHFGNQAWLVTKMD